MDLNNGKPEGPRKITFLDREYLIKKIPVGIAAPFSVEIAKLRKMSIDAAEKIAEGSDTEDDLPMRTIQYFSDNPELADEYNRQSVRVVACYTEFVTDGEVDEKKIMMEASADEVNDFVMELQGVVNSSLKKQLETLMNQKEN